MAGAPLRDTVIGWAKALFSAEARSRSALDSIYHLAVVTRPERPPPRLISLLENTSRPAAGIHLSCQI